MNVTEFRNEFNELYDSVASNNAPALDDYNISVFLTQAQEQLIKSKYSPKTNMLQEGFEQSTRRRNDLRNLIKDYKTSLEQSSTKNISDDSKFYLLPSDIFLIIQESSDIINSDCNNEIQNFNVKLITYDEYNLQRQNPFKKPSNRLVWRMDYSAQEFGNNVAELITPYEISSYNVRYLKYPKPIILSDLTVFGEGLSINGQTSAATSELDEAVHREILKRAVEIAILSLRENTLANTVQLNSRNE